MRGVWVQAESRALERKLGLNVTQGSWKAASCGAQGLTWKTQVAFAWNSLHLTFHLLDVLGAKLNICLMVWKQQHLAFNGVFVAVRFSKAWTWTANKLGLEYSIKSWLWTNNISFPGGLLYHAAHCPSRWLGTTAVKLRQPPAESLLPDVCAFYRPFVVLQRQYCYQHVRSGSGLWFSHETNFKVCLFPSS